ncbi:hypothetical protein [Mesobacterium pallidum]|uniref:hypothetical protein n=1 Tax=Mesobacterium pallidum TaxID=2872037 RepID=UPI001EE156FD|nr:hypothetical protein [Mesobacterium pallidum]
MTAQPEFIRPRRLRVFSFDPSSARSYENRDFRHVTITLAPDMDPELGLGPTGDCIEVIDYDPASRCFYRPFDPEAAEIRENDGLTPSAEDPRFHQQMVYAVAMNTVALFEEALGRHVQWAPREHKVGDEWRIDYVKRLRIYPHALREANAFYDPARKALLFGYFEAGASSGAAPPGSTVFTCLSHDIIVHETVHAILDGMHPRFVEDSGPDMRALHEAFSDIVALLQLFSFPEVLKSQIARTRGDLEKQSMLGQLAQEFGQSLGRAGALRSALGDVKDGVWTRRQPDRFALRKAHGPHERGAILVAAIFDAYLAIYKRRTADLFRIASGGSGLLREGEIDPDLCRRLSEEAAHTARRVLSICIRAMDYVPPVAVTFGDYLRALVTADHDLYPEDKLGYRDAFVDSFAEWGIVPAGMAVMTEPALLWPSLRQVADDIDFDLHGSEVPEGEYVNFSRLYAELGAAFERPDVVESELQDWVPQSQGKLADESMNRNARNLEASREQGLKILQTHLSRLDAARKTRGRATGREDSESVGGTVDYKTLETQPTGLTGNLFNLFDGAGREVDFHIRDYYSRLIWLLLVTRSTPELLRTLGIVLGEDAPLSIRRSGYTGLPSVHVLPIRLARRVGRNGALEREYVIELQQSRQGFFDPDHQAKADGEPGWLRMALNSETGEKYLYPAADFTFRAGCTLIVNARTFAIRRLIRSAATITDDAALGRLRDHLARQRHAEMTAFSDDPVPDESAFSALHRHGPDATGGFR